MANSMSYRSQIRTASGLDVLIGTWVVLSPFILAFESGRATTNNVIVGGAMVLLAATRALGAHRAAWMSWVNAVLGLWLILSPWVLLFAGTYAPTVNNILAGLAVVGLATWSALATESAQTQERREQELETRVT